VKYRVEYNSGTDKYKLPKAPELIKIAHSVAAEVFYDSTSDYDAKWVTLSDLQYDYGQQIFFDVANEKNMFFVSTQVSGGCVNSVYDYINIIFYDVDVVGDNVSEDYIPDGDESIIES
jgi:hypothetical protein